MNNKELKLILSKDIFARRLFKGVFPRDRLPQYVPQGPGIYIINTDHSSGPGEHWVCVCFDGRGNAEYFDSFGLPPLIPSIQRFITRNSFYSYTFNQRLLQRLTSSYCGFYVLYYVLMKSRGASLYRIQQNFFVNNLWGNDRRVKANVKYLVHK